MLDVPLRPWRATLKYRFTIFADYYQFYIQDDDMQYGDLSDAWTAEAVDRRLAIAPHTIGVGTVRNTRVPVTLELFSQPHEIDRAVFDKTNDCVIQIDAGRLVIAGTTDYFPDAQRVDCTPGIYHVFVGYKGLNTILADGLQGQDSYHIIIWPVDS